MDVSRTPAVDAIAEGIGARLDGTEEVIAVVVRQQPSAAAEIRIDWRDVGVVTMAVAAASIGLPDFDQRVGDRAAIAVQHVTVNDGLLADRRTGLGVVQDQIMIQRSKFVARKSRTRDFG